MYKIELPLPSIEDMEIIPMYFNLLKQDHQTLHNLTNAFQACGNFSNTGIDRLDGRT